MTLGRRLAALAVAVGVAGGLCGCVGDPKPTPTPTPSATPLYSSEAEALAAAKEAYARYVAVSNEVAHNGWKDLAPLETVATGDALKADAKAGERNSEQGLHIEGDATGEVVSVQMVESTRMTIYACADYSGTKVLDTDGNDRTSPNRTDVIAYEVVLTPKKASLLIQDVDQWPGDSFC